jgi:hypothetical protein
LEWLCVVFLAASIAIIILLAIREQSGLFGVFAQFETKLRKERQMEGIAKANAEGVYKGRPAPTDSTEILKMHDEGIGATESVKKLSIGRTFTGALRTGRTSNISPRLSFVLVA